MERKIKGSQRRKYSQLKQYQDSQEKQLFIQAQTYPSFFDQNLVDEQRKIKVFHDNPHTNQIVFYFQLLKLIFESEDTHYQKYLQKIYDIIDNPDFQIHFPKSNHPYYLPITTSKIKRILVEFLDQMGEGGLGVEQALKKYPIINKVFVLFLRTLLIIAEQCVQFDQEMDPMQLYELLANYFQIEITYYGNCLRFNQVDVFVYFVSSEEVYLAYISPSEQEGLSSSELYHSDPQEDFNISSVKQMVSEIDIEIPIETDCFIQSKRGIENNSSEVNYSYSNSSEARVVARTFNEGSDLKFSYLINEDSFQNVKSNKILEKELIGQKKLFGNNYKLPTQIECYKIDEVPFEVQNAITPSLTPRQSKFVSFGKEQAQKYDKENIYGRKRKQGNLKDIIKEQYEMLSNYQSAFKNNQVYLDTAQSWNKRQSQEIIDCEQPKQVPTLKSLYGLKSIKSIYSEQNESFQSPLISKMPSKKPTMAKEQPPIKPTSKNISSQFTSSFILQQMKEPYQSNIRSIKVRSRVARPNLQRMMLL